MMILILLLNVLITALSLWLAFVLLYASLKFFKWLRKWNP